MVAEDQISIDIFLICPEHFVPPFMEYVYVVGFGPLALAVEVLSYIRQLFRRKRNVNSWHVENLFTYGRRKTVWVVAIKSNWNWDEQINTKKKKQLIMFLGLLLKNKLKACTHDMRINNKNVSLHTQTIKHSNTVDFYIVFCSSFHVWASSTFILQSAGLTGKWSSHAGMFRRCVFLGNEQVRVWHLPTDFNSDTNPREMLAFPVCLFFKNLYVWWVSNLCWIRFKGFVF